MTDIELRCAACGSEHPQGKRFCADCGARLPVLCSACHAPQPAENHFCQDCGAALEGWCPSCGHAVSRGKAFCGTCGASLGSGAVPHGVPGAASVRGEAEREERRLVTALFCDLTGFTPLTERLDAEQIREIQSDYFQRMSGEIARFGGHVEKYAGDAVLALFGVPITHGDDAERALLCALAMQEAIGSLASDARQRWQVDLGLRVGVNTGEAVSGLTDVAGRKDYSVTGDVLNTAARLQTAAEPGTVMAGEETMRLARKTVRFGERRELALKGKARPVPAYQVLGRRELLHERFDDQSQTPLVGRDHELGILREAWTRAESGEGQLVTVVGDAGLGKSRLIAEVTTLQEPLNRAVYRARGVSYGQDISLSLIAELVRSILRVNDQEDPALVRQRLDEMIQTLPAGELEEGAATAAGVLGELLGLGAADEAPAGTEAQARRRELVKTLRLLLLASSRRNPTIILFDDLQWIDSASAEVLTEVLGDIVSLRICVLAAHRPGWSAPWSEWPWIERLNLRPLKSDDARALAQRIAGDARISPDLHRYIDDRAGGNPFFIEELLLILRETGSIVERDGRLELVGGTADRLPSTLT
ncbi:MAG: AAA family ATPase, partial [Chloroflexota bacterium]